MNAWTVFSVGRASLRLCVIFNRPSEAGHSCSIHTFVINVFINSLSWWSFCLESSRHCLSQTIKARKLKFLENIHPHHVSHVRCQVSAVKCHHIFFFWQRWSYMVGGLFSTGPSFKVISSFGDNTVEKTGFVCYLHTLQELGSIPEPGHNVWLPPRVEHAHQH